jgi:putative Ca2+/H+ antiporter (TMEM165/GDT1 family)
VSVGVVFATFLIIGVAEFPDKTMIATLIMGSRSRPLLVWIGASAAFAIHTTVAVVAGRLITLLPQHTVDIVVTILFGLGAAYLLFVPERAEIVKGTSEAAPTEELGRGAGVASMKVVATAFGVILVGEIGDLTQLLTMNLAAHYHDPWSVFVGALAALLTVSAIGAYGGRALLRWLPVQVIRRAGGVVLVGFTAYGIYSLVK